MLAKEYILNYISPSAAVRAERPPEPFGTGGNKSQQKNITSTSVILFGFCSWLTNHGISAQQKALTVSTNAIPYNQVLLYKFGYFFANSILPYMNKLITEKLASNIVIIILSLVVIFHVLILMNFIPFNIVWGGRIKDKSQLLRFELISIAVNLLMLVVVLMKARVFNVDINQKLITISLWVMVALFILNTIGNLLSINDFERFVFTPLTIMLSVFCLKLALSRKPKECKTL